MANLWKAKSNRGMNTDFNYRGGMGSLIVCVKRDKYLYLLLIPFLAYFILFYYKPLYGLIIAFKDYSPFKGIEKSPWVGFNNFKMFFNIPDFWIIVRNTVVISLYTLVIGFPLPIILALLFNEVRNLKFKKFVQTLTYMPYFVSSVVIAGLVYSFLSPSYGFVNQIIKLFGGKSIYFLMEKDWFRTIYILMGVWKYSGFNAIIYLAALTGIDPQLYESAYMDGAGKWKQLLHVTFPGILPTVIVMFIISVGSLFSVNTEHILLLYQPATYETADVIGTYVYRFGLGQQHYSLGTAVDLLNSLLALIMVSVTNYISKRKFDISIY